MVLQHTGDRLVKRKRALLESNRPRNSRLETRLNDEAGALALASAPPSVDRFPDAWENS